MCVYTCVGGLPFLDLSTRRSISKTVCEVSRHVARVPQRQRHSSHTLTPSPNVHAQVARTETFIIHTHTRAPRRRVHAQVCIQRHSSDTYTPSPNAHV